MSEEELDKTGMKKRDAASSVSSFLCVPHTALTSHVADNNHILIIAKTSLKMAEEEGWGMSWENTKNNRSSKEKREKCTKDLVVLFDFLIFGERVVGARFPFS